MPKRVASLRDPSRHCARATAASFEEMLQPWRSIFSSISITIYLRKTQQYAPVGTAKDQNGHKCTKPL